MYGYECYYEGRTSIIYVRHIDTGYSIRYYETQIKSEGALEDALSQLDEDADDYYGLKEAFGDWVYGFTKQRRKAVKQQMKNSIQFNTACQAAPEKTESKFPAFPVFRPTNISLGNQTMVITSCSGWSELQETNQEKGNNPMCYANTTADTETSQRNYLLKQLAVAYTTKHDAMHTAFHMNPQGPKNIGEMLQWIKDGKYADLKDNEKENIWLNEIGYFIKWEDKANPPQTEKYNEARKLLNKAHTDAERIIKIKSPEAGLDALTAFESATFH